MRYLAALLLLALPQKQINESRLQSVVNPRPANSWVSDAQHHLSPATVARIDSVVNAVERANGTEIAVVVIDSLDRLEPSDPALTLHRRWGLGQPHRDNRLVAPRRPPHR